MVYLSDIVFIVFVLFFVFLCGGGFESFEVFFGLGEFFSKLVFFVLEFGLEKSDISNVMFCGGKMDVGEFIKVVLLV